MGDSFAKVPKDHNPNTVSMFSPNPQLQCLYTAWPPWLITVEVVWCSRKHMGPGHKPYAWLYCCVVWGKSLTFKPQLSHLQMDSDSSLYNYLTELRESSKIMIRKGFINNRMLPKHHLLWEHFGFCFMGAESGVGTHWILEGSRRQVRTEPRGIISGDLAFRPLWEEGCLFYLGPRETDRKICLKNSGSGQDHQRVSGLRPFPYPSPEVAPKLPQMDKNEYSIQPVG